jgi:phosphoenolpyruvate carboxykinase (GTP)
MLPFCGYHMGDYFRHWIKMQRSLSMTPRIFHVNWFRKGADGKFLWPGYGDNSRVLQWICERVEGTATARETQIGNLPTHDSLNLAGLNVPAENIEQLIAVDVAGWKKEIEDVAANYAKFGERLPGALHTQLDELRKRLG